MTQNLLHSPSPTSGTIRRAPHPHGAHAETALTALGLTPAELKTLREEGAV
ncbi:hypothetical protein ACIBW9_05600 [Streptomyces sp. NPDC049541]|uniref:hypothetical protein n=1 Tax=Streptomyces sp. NPDC049541 TaxID=3365594 RepID=UPI0037B0393A